MPHALLNLTSSLKARFVLYTSAVAIVILAIGTLAIVSVYQSTHALDEAIEDATREQYPVLRMEKLVQRAEMEAHDFLMYRDETHKQRLGESIAEVNRAFGDLLHAPFDMDQEKTLAREAFSRWKEASGKIVRHPVQTPAADAISEMERFDAEVTRILESLSGLLDQVNREINDRVADAYAVKMRLIFGVSVLFLFCMGVVIVLGVLAARSILGPVRALNEGVRRISMGDYDFRVDTSGSHELSVLSHSFNTMAERLRQDREIIEQLSIRDSQTGLYNRKYFDAMLADELQLARRSQGVFSVIRMDLKEFEDIKARHPSHVLTGVLQATASVIARNIRTVDRAAYLGNGSFGIVLRETSETGARIKAEALCAKIESDAISPPHPPVSHLDLHAGIAAVRRGTETGSDLVRAAEADMQKHK